MKKLLSFILIFVAAAAAMLAQGPTDPVNWKAQVKMKTATEGSVVFTATVLPGWHLYGMQMPKDGPKATSFDFTGSTGVKFTGKPKASKKAMSKHDEMFDATVTYWEGKVRFVQHFTITDASKAHIAAAVSYMGCNDETCAPPKTKKFALKVPVPAVTADASTGASTHK